MNNNEPAGWHWIEAWRNETMSPHDFAEFQAALKSDAEVRNTLRKAMAMDSALRDMAEAESLQDVWTAAPAPERRDDRSWMKAAALLAAGLFVGSLGMGAAWAFSGSDEGRFIPTRLSIFDGGFEHQESFPEFGYPTAPGSWTGDPSEIVNSGDQGITAFEGTQMLRFQKTSVEGESGKSQRANRWQIFALDDLHSENEPLIVTARAQFNRVAGGPYTDTQARVEVVAFSGSPATTERQLDAAEFLTRTITRVDLDSDPTNWEAVAASILVPRGTDFLLIGVSATENVRNDPPDQIEFDGHYVDAVELVISQTSSLTPKKRRKLFGSQSNP
ncbi:MAG: hypothetical protein AAGH89_16640 [Verrucomicrobiota bacterium]